MQHNAEKTSQHAEKQDLCMFHFVQADDGKDPFAGQQFIDPYRGTERRDFTKTFTA